MLRPSEHWFWTYCPNKDRLLLDISDEAQFCSPYSGNLLRQKPQQQALSMAEAEMFWAADDSLQQLDMPAAVRLEICLAALCASFIQQQGHKSWYFQQLNTYQAKPFELVTLRGLTTQYALVVATEEQSVCCLLLGDIDTLAGKALSRLQFIRVLNNRVAPLAVAASLRNIA
mgnify:CR=1 FL=1